MVDTVGDEDIRNNDLGLVDPDSAVVDNNVELLTLRSGKRTVLEGRAVAKSVVDNVVLENALEIRLAQVGEDRANVGKGAVAGSKDSDVLLIGEVCDELGLGEGASNGGEVGGNGRVGKVLGKSEDLVDDVDDTASEVEVLSVLVSGVVDQLDDLQPW
jgi:hypothetical protein